MEMESYERLELEITEFDGEDVITTSGDLSPKNDTYERYKIGW